MRDPAGSDFLAEMAAASMTRAQRLRESSSEAGLLDEIRDRPQPPPLRLDDAGFDLIAEIKTASPSAGVLAAPDADLRARAASYARSGACAVSVLTEPQHFGGSLDDLAAVADELRAFGIPAMAKDFLVDPRQILAVRAAGAGGVLLIVRILDDARLTEMLDVAHRLGMFALIEAFDEQDLSRAGRLVSRCEAGPERALVGINCRDLKTLAIDPARLDSLAAYLPAGCVAVAESGMFREQDAGHVARLGYRVALVGTALMKASDPAGLVTAMLKAGRDARRDQR